MKSTHLLLTTQLLTALLLFGCDRGGDGYPTFDSDFVETEDPNQFLAYLNKQVGLPAGNYKIVVGTDSSGQSGSFSLMIEYDDRDDETLSGSWDNSGGQDALSANNPSFDFKQQHSGGIRITVASAVSTCLYLLDHNNSVIVGENGADLCANPSEISLAASAINDRLNAIAYYRAIDPDDTRDTLEKWKQANHFGEPCGDIDPCETHVIFRDTKDLGYGRSMYTRRNDDGSVAIFVENFRVDAVPGQGYTDFNLEAAIRNQVRWHFGSNAIEFSTYPYGSGEPREIEDAPLFAKFYTFRPEDVMDPDSTENRIYMIDLDSRGEKSMPGPCVLCHGGRTRPLLENGEYPPYIPGGIAGDVDAQLQILEVDTFGFSEISGYSREEQEDKIRFVNQAILSTYETTHAQARPGHMQGDFLKELLIGRYGGDIDAESPYSLPDNRYNGEDTRTDDYIPVGWRPNSNTGNPPAGADILFREVIGPHCSVCHARRGSNLGSNTNANGNGKDIDFSTYEKFISHADQIESYIYKRGVMPLSILNFDAFWDSSEPHRPTLLGNFLPNFQSSSEDNNDVQRPGEAVAIPAAPNRSNVPMTLSAEGSAFTTSYTWSVSNTPSDCDAVSLDDTSSVRPTLSGGENGCTYTIQLITGNETSQSDPVEIDITIDTSLIAPREISFATDIRAVLGDSTTPETCATCHSTSGASSVEGIPAHWTIDQIEDRELYREIRQRINFSSPLDSKLLRKPSGNHHYGGCRAGFDLSSDDGDCLGTNDDRSNYNLFLSWILEGAAR